MSKRPTPGDITLVIGLGISGLACIRHLLERGVEVLAVDTREQPPGLEQARSLLGDRCTVGPDVRVSWDAVGRVVVSPGLSPEHPLLQSARQAGVPVLGELALFAGVATAPVIAVTGSNGKSTVCTLLAAMLSASGLRVAVGGNLGPAALDLLTDPEPELYVLEVSSFQLEAAGGFRPALATVLNVSPDHLDRHGSMEAYAAVKQRIFAADTRRVLNRGDERVRRMADAGSDVIWFGTDRPVDGGYGVIPGDDGDWLAVDSEPLLPVSCMQIRGRHNLANALAALALAERAGADRAACLSALQAYPGLPHRMEPVASDDGLTWINDSKATNVGAAAAALAGLDRPCVLLAGGQGKGQDFSSLAAAIDRRRVRAVVVYGQDAPALQDALGVRTHAERVDDLDQAVRAARRLAQPGDLVLLSPACASLDQFRDYAARGERFRSLVGGGSGHGG